MVIQFFIFSSEVIIKFINLINVKKKKLENIVFKLIQWHTHNLCMCVCIYMDMWICVGNLAKVYRICFRWLFNVENYTDVIHVSLQWRQKKFFFAFLLSKEKKKSNNRIQPEAKLWFFWWHLLEIVTHTQRISQYRTKGVMMMTMMVKLRQALCNVHVCVCGFLPSHGNVIVSMYVNVRMGKDKQIDRQTDGHTHTQTDRLIVTKYKPSTIFLVFFFLSIFFCFVRACECESNTRW